ncbi:hypothetical protein Tco_1394245 [Tanacetum coccineum]
MFLLKDMDQDSAHMVAASKVPMLKPGEYETLEDEKLNNISNMMRQKHCGKFYRDGATLSHKHKLYEELTEMPITTAEEKAQRRLESDQAEEGPNYALMAFSSSSPDSEKSELMVLCYKTSLESVEEKLEVYKANKSIYLQDIKGLKFEIHIGEMTIRELRKKLEIVQKEKDGIQLNVYKFEHASKSLNKLIECQMIDNCKTGLGYENYNAVPPPYTGNFMPPTPDLSFTGLDEFVNKPVVENYKAMSSEEEPKVVRKYDDAQVLKIGVK